jgi:hypothetical protein
MLFPANVRRIVLVVLDGLRPDAVEAFGMRHLARLARRSAHTLEARTVAPSVTAACMASLFSGVSPDVHGLRSERFHIPRARGRIDLLPRILAEAALPSSAFVRQVPMFMRGTATRIARHLGFTHSAFIAGGASAVMGAALDTVLTQREGLIVMHWPDCDQAGHDHGWMSEPYGRAAHLLDGTLGALLGVLDLEHDPSTVLIALADHGGGGTVHDHHDSDHPLDRTIPVVIAGRAVEPGRLGGTVTLLDVPATIPWALGLTVPASYGGRPLVEAFVGAAEAAA